MRIVIIGAGEVGIYLAQCLLDEDHDVTMIDSDPEKIERTSDNLDLKGFVGSGTCVATLDQADVGKADLLLAMTNSEEANMLASYFGKCLGAKSIIARMSSEDALGDHSNFYRHRLGVDLVINPARVAAAEVTATIQRRSGSGIAEFGFGRVHFRPFNVLADSPATKKPISELNLPGALIAAVIRDGEVTIPGGDDRMQADDSLIVICKPEAIPYVQKSVGESTDRVKRIIIVGGGNVGSAIAHYFDTPRYRAKLFEDDRRRAWQLADDLNYVKVIDSDGTDIAVLEEEYISSTDAFVSATGSDEKNIMTAILAREHGVPVNIAVVDQQQYATVGNKLGLTATLAPRILAANQVLSFVHGGNVNRISLIAEGQAEVIEFRATRHCRITDKPLAELDLPRGIIIGALIRGSKAIIPKGTEMIHEGDSVVLFTLDKQLPFVNALLERNRRGELKDLQATAESEA